MYEDTKSSFDWKGLFLKVIIAFLVILIAIKGYSMLKGNTDKNKKENAQTQETADSNASSTFTSNMEKLRAAGKTYFEKSKEKLPSVEGNTVMVTLNELVNSGELTNLSDEDGKTCDGESSYVTATLDNNEYKLKANLVCGSASSYSLVYLGENDSETKNTTTTNNSSNTTSKTTSSSNNCGNSCSTSCSNGTCVSSVSVSTSTSVSQSVSINNNSSQSNSSSNNGSNNASTVKYYTVSFDANGGRTSYRSQTIKANDVATYPGSNSKSGYEFLGWYLNGVKYDFDTPVTKNITLVAKYRIITDDYLYDDTYDDDIVYEESLVTRTYTTEVYTMGWDTYGTNYININHTLKLPSYLNDSDITKVRIKNIEFVSAIDTTNEINSYYNNHSKTFIYTSSVWDADVLTKSSLAVIKGSSVDFEYSKSYKTLSRAKSTGFDVSWDGNVQRQCGSTFSVNGVSNLCNYGIVYEVTWEYQIYE